MADRKKNPSDLLKMTTKPPQIRKNRKIGTKKKGDGRDGGSHCSGAGGRIRHLRSGPAPSEEKEGRGLLRVQRLFRMRSGCGRSGFRRRGLNPRAIGKGTGFDNRMEATKTAAPERIRKDFRRRGCFSGRNQSFFLKNFR